MKEKLKEQVVKAGQEILNSGLVFGTWGNISCRFPEADLIAITPSGLEYDGLVLSDIVIVDLNGKVVEGGRKPSSELLLHLEVYKQRADVGAIVHTHSVYASAMAVLGKPLPPILEDLAQAVGGETAVATYAPAGSAKLAHNAALALGQMGAVLLSNHGVVCVGRNIKEALRAAIIIERAAQVYLCALKAGEPKVLSPEEVKAVRKFYLDVYTK